MFVGFVDCNVYLDALLSLKTCWRIDAVIFEQLYECTFKSQKQPRVSWALWPSRRAACMMLLPCGVLQRSNGSRKASQKKTARRTWTCSPPKMCGWKNECLFLSNSTPGWVRSNRLYTERVYRRTRLSGVLGIVSLEQSLNLWLAFFLVYKALLLILSCSSTLLGRFSDPREAPSKDCRRRPEPRFQSWARAPWGTRTR